MKKPKILLTNDDGIRSKGMRCLWESLKDFADLKIVAPMVEQSGAGASITFGGPLETKAFQGYEGTPAWMVDGKPADCVKIALSALLSEEPDLIVSGINHGSNAGRNVLYSGTIGATIQGVIQGIPGLAVSYACSETEDFPHVQPYIPRLVKYLLEHPLRSGSILNVNFPHVPPDKIKGVKMARQGLSHWVDQFRQDLHPEGHHQYWLEGKQMSYDEHEESDTALLHQGYITAVPLHVNELTDHSHISEMKTTFESQIFLPD